MAQPQVMPWVLGASFLAMAGWILVPDKVDDETSLARFGVLCTTLIAIFLAEMGDKTQIANVALAA
jgi:putative Ca2+/H+ antiporter (TMEM165/GDT1 family)